MENEGHQGTIVGQGLSVIRQPEEEQEEEGTEEVEMEVEEEVMNRWRRRDGEWMEMKTKRRMEIEEGD